MAILAVLLTSVTTARADRMKDNDYFTMKNYGDHLTFTLQMADTYSNNTYSDWGGIICTSGSSSVEVVIIYSGDGDDDGDNWTIHAMDRNSENWGGVCIITNIHPSGESVITRASEANSYTIKKSNKYPKAKIDFYWPPSMAGKTWNFTYQFNHVKNSGSDGGWQTMQLGSTYLGYSAQDLGYSNVNLEDFTFERASMGKMKFTVPALPDDIPARIKDYRWHEASYDLKFTYTMPSGKVVTSEVKDKKSEVGKTKTYEIDIPAEVQKYKTMDVRVVGLDMLKNSNGKNYWNVERTYFRPDLFANAPQPRSLAAEYRQFDNEAALVWEAYNVGDRYIHASVPYVYRIETNASGTPLSGQSWVKRGTLAEVGTTRSQNYTDQGLKSGTNYRYMVLNVPKAWIDNGVSTSDLNSPSASLLERLPYVQSDVVCTNPTMSIYDLRQDVSVTDEVRLTWSYSRVPVSAKTVTFKVLRRTTADGEWSEYGNVSADSNPAAGAVCSFNDKNLPNSRARYEYKVVLELNNGAFRFESDPVVAGFLSGTLVRDIDATKGTHESTVRVTWRAKQVGTSNSSYVVSRRYAGSNDDFMEIYTASGTAEQYVYEDKTAMPGYYYEYKVDVYGGDHGDYQHALTDVGFCQARGVVSGAVNFGSGTAVKDVRMNLIPNADSQGTTADDGAVRGYSKRFDGASTGISWDADEEEVGKIFGEGKDFTVQMFLRPDAGLGEGVVIGEIPGVGRLVLDGRSSGGCALLLARGNGRTPMSFVLPDNEFSCLTVIMSGNKLSIQVDDSKLVAIPSEYIAGTAPGMVPLCVGGASGITAEQAFHGNITEVRVFDHALSEAERTSYADRTLNGRENGLRLYWPMDEGLDRYVFDASYANDVPNGRHATVGNSVTTSVIVPTQAQLSRYGLTNDQGEYIIRGIPFAGSGSSYRVVPELGIHEFSPNSRSMFISPTSLTANNVDFEDVSSFPMEGYIYYAGTNIPAEGIQLYIDGELVSANGKVKETDANGRYEISVPIGKHYIEARKDGHTMVAGGRFPTEGTYDFTRAMTYDFADSTLVNFVGRVGGGERNDTLAVGFGASTNNIGMATVVLRINNESFSFNCADDHISDAATQRTWESDTTAVNSHAWTGTGYDSKYIYIRTDSLTGEFSAKLPPLKYATKSITVDKNPDIEFTTGPEIDLTNPHAKIADTLYVEMEGGSIDKRVYHYNKKQVFTHYALPQLDIVEKDNAEGVYGLSAYGEVDQKGDTLKIEHLWTIGDDGKPNYLFGYPIYRMGDEYEYELFAYESYTNRDGKTAVTEKIPLKGQVLKFLNEMENDQTVVYSVPNEVNDHFIGEIYNPKTKECRLGADGKGIYKWGAGYPNVTSPFTRHLEASMTRKNRTYILKTMDAVVLGSLTTGNNFVTKGPDNVDFVLRDPPGAKSKTTLKRGKITRTETYETGGFYDNSTVLTNNIFGENLTTGAGFGLMLITSQQMEFTIKAGVHLEYQHAGSTEKTYTTTYTEAISTGTAYPYVSTQGDVYVGTSTNLLFGICRYLHVVKQGNNYALTVEDAQSLGTSVATTFMYSQYELETVMIPKWKDQRNAFMKTAQVVADSTAAYAYTNTGNHGVYLTWAKPGDKDYGIYRYRWAAPTDASKVDVSEVDSVAWCTNQIRAWENTIRRNESDKVGSMEKLRGWRNFSIDGANTYTFSERKDTTVVNRYRDNWKVGAILGGDVGWHWFGAASAGCILNVTTQNGKAWATGTGDDTQDYAEWEYTIADGNRDTDISINQYDSYYSNYSKMFSVFGGQTYNPYHDADSTHYYTPKTELNTATVRMEQPDLRISVNGQNPSKTITLTDIPSGQEVNLTLHCTNLANAHQGLDFSYNLVIVEKTNVNGLQILMDGVPINGRSIRIPQSETVTKQITIRQTDQSILDYEGVRLRFCSQYQPLLIKDEVTLNAHFTPSSSPIDLVINEPVLNTETLARTEGMLLMKLTNYNRQFKNLKSIGVEYRYEGNTAWNTIHTYVTDRKDSVNSAYSVLGNQGTVSLNYDMGNDNLFPQGKYTFRAFTTTPYGDNPNDAAIVYSPEVTVIKDNVRPRNLTTPTPANGILRHGDDLSIEFNEDIVPGYVSDKNIIVTAKLNSQHVNHDVALQLQRRGGMVYTENPVFLNGDFSTDFWVNCEANGTILQLGLASNRLALSIDNDGHVVFNLAGTAMVSKETLPFNTWIYMVISYRADAKTFSMLAQYGSESVNLFSNQTVELESTEAIRYSDDNRLYLGPINGAIHDMSLFNIYRDVHDAASTKYVAKDNYVYGLTNYWPMDEGHGNIVADTRHTHNIIAETSWQLANTNYGLFNDNMEGFNVNISQINTRRGDSYAIEMWNDNYDGVNGGEVVFETGSEAVEGDANSPNMLRLRFDNSKNMVLDYGEKTQTVVPAELYDNTHSIYHLALNVVRGQAASFYFNGQRTAVIAEADVPPIVGTNMRLAKNFSAYYDELRIWKATLTEKRLLANMYNCIDTTDVYSRGLAAYFPFEKSGTENGVATKVFTLEDMAPTGTLKATPCLLETIGTAQGIQLPTPLKNAPEETRLIAAPVASERKVVINLTDVGISPRDIEGTTLNITVDKIHDMHGNESLPIRWTAYVQQNTLKWTKDSVNVIKRYGDPYTFEVNIENKGGNTEYYTLYNMPQWLTLVSALDGFPVETTDDIAPLSTKTLRFSVSPLVAVGTYDVTIGLQGNNEIQEPLRIVMNVRAEAPAWSVDPSKYENTMSIVGQIYINGVLMGNSESMLAAFIGDECRGVAALEQMRGAAYVALTVYGTAQQDVNGKVKDLDNGKAVTFRIWDAAAGVAYINVNTVIDGSPVDTLRFDPTQDYGTFDTPVIFTKSNYVEQQLALKQGWNWLSLGVEPADTTPSVVFKDLTSWNVRIKDRATGASYCNGTYWAGNLEGIHANIMYKMLLNRLSKSKDFPQPLPIIGEQVKLAEAPVTLKEGWNWIAYTPATTMTLDEALAGANPQIGDQVKAQTGFSYYGPYGWEGNLKALESGKGYLYQSIDKQTKTFVYPSASAPSRVQRRSPLRGDETPSGSSLFTPVAPTAYPDNMSMVIMLTANGEPVADAEVAAFVDGECCGAAFADGNLYYLLIAGEGSGLPMELKAAVNGNVYTVGNTLSYNSDGSIGTPLKPYVIDITDMATGITGLTPNTQHPIPGGIWYTLQGFRIGTTRPTAPGIYLYNGQKVTITKRVQQ